jgi:predicted GIY-YIG superfamily endonuclease
MRNELSLCPSEIRMALKRHGFDLLHRVEGRVSVVDLFARSKRRGIYVLRFADSWYYVGQTKDVVKRYAQHRVVHGDISHIAFLPCLQRELIEHENAMIAAMEASGARLRNRLKVELLELESDFDAVMARPIQERWIDDVTFADLEGPRVDDPDLRARTEARAGLVRNRPSFTAILPAFGQVILDVVPAPFRSELSFWVTSVLPYGPKSELYLRLNVGFQTLFDAGYDQDRRRPYVSWWIPRDVAAELSGNEFTKGKTFKISHGRKTISECVPSPLTHGAADQVILTYFDPEPALDHVADERRLRALRRFALGLVRKGTCPMRRSHHPALVDDAVDAAVGLPV